MIRAWGALVVAGCLVSFMPIGGELPDPKLTPGVVASTDEAEVCGFVGGLSYSKRHRATTAEMKAEVRRRYGRTHCGEIDHRVPLALGGADVVENLWCQPGPDEAVWNFILKDALEFHVWASVCHDHTMSLAQGQTLFLEPDLTEQYCGLIAGEVCR